MRVLPVALCLLAAGALFGAPSAHAAGDAAKGKIKAQTCLGCHGIADYTNAYPEFRVPKLGGQHADYIVAALKEYANGGRQHPTMHAQAASMSEQDMQDIAAYLESLGGKVENPEPVGKAPEKAQVCASCHGKTGLSQTAQFPILAGQHPDYLMHALEGYKGSMRNNAIMKGMVGSLDKADMQELADWFSKQQSPLKTLPRDGTPMEPSE